MRPTNAGVSDSNQGGNGSSLGLRRHYEWSAIAVELGGFIVGQSFASPTTVIERIDPPQSGGPPFSGAVVAGPFVFVSGQVGIDPRTGTTPVGVKAQTQIVLSNIEAKLSKAGCDLKDVVKATVFLADIRGFEEMNEVYRAAFAPDFPARSTIEARLARPEFLVEIEVVALRPQGRKAT